MNVIIEEIKKDLLAKGVSQQMIDDAEKLGSEYDIWSIFNTAIKTNPLALSNSGLRVKLMATRYSPFIFVENKNPKDIALIPDLETSEYYMFSTRDAECLVSKSPHGTCKLWKSDGKTRELVGKYAGSNALEKLYKDGVSKGLHIPMEFVSRKLNIYLVAPLLHGISSAYQEAAKDKTNYEDLNSNLSDLFGILAKSNLLSEIGAPLDNEMKVIEPKNLSKHTNLFGPADDLDKASTHKDFELIWALHELNPKYAFGWKNEKLYVVDKDAELACPYEEFEQSWSFSLKFNLNNMTVELPHYETKSLSSPDFAR